MIKNKLSIGRANSVDPHCESYYSTSPYAWCGNNFVNIVDPSGMDWYRTNDSTGVIWIEGSEEREGYTNIGSTYTTDIDEYGISITYEQDERVSMEETVLKEEDWETQMMENSQIKPGDEGNCFVQAGKMVSYNGATSLKGPENDITSLSEQTDYIESQILNGHSVRVHVDYNGDNKGDHWVTITSKITNLKDNSVSYKFFDPGTVHKDKGSSSKNILIVSKHHISGKTAYREGITYRVTAVRRNK